MPKSKSDVHLTPKLVYQKIERIWKYKKDEMFDPCPPDTPYKAPCFFNGLYVDYHKVNYVNPPYGQGRIKGEKTTLIGKFVDKAINESFKGKKTIMLLPSKTDQEWFHRIVRMNYEIHWWYGRIHFANNKDTATQPHFLVMIG